MTLSRKSEVEEDASANEDNTKSVNKDVSQGVDREV